MNHQKAIQHIQRAIKYAHNHKHSSKYAFGSMLLEGETLSISENTIPGCVLVTSGTRTFHVKWTVEINPSMLELMNVGVITVQKVDGTSVTVSDKGWMEASFEVIEEIKQSQWFTVKTKISTIVTDKDETIDMTFQTIGIMVTNNGDQLRILHGVIDKCIPSFEIKQGHPCTIEKRTANGEEKQVLYSGESLQTLRYVENKALHQEIGSKLEISCISTVEKFEGATRHKRKSDQFSVPFRISQKHNFLVDGSSIPHNSGTYHGTATVWHFLENSTESMNYPLELRFEVSWLGEHVLTLVSSRQFHSRPVYELNIEKSGTKSRITVQGGDAVCNMYACVWKDKHKYAEVVQRNFSKMSQLKRSMVGDPCSMEAIDQEGGSCGLNSVVLLLSKISQLYDYLTPDVKSWVDTVRSQQLLSQASCQPNILPHGVRNTYKEITSNPKKPTWHDLYHEGKETFNLAGYKLNATNRNKFGAFPGAFIAAVLLHCKIMPEHCSVRREIKPQPDFSKIGRDTAKPAYRMQLIQNRCEATLSQFKEWVKKSAKGQYDKYKHLLGGILTLVHEDDKALGHAVPFTMCEGNPIICSWGQCSDNFNWTRLNLLKFNEIIAVTLVYAATHGLLASPPQEAREGQHGLIRRRQGPEAPEGPSRPPQEQGGRELLLFNVQPKQYSSPFVPLNSVHISLRVRNEELKVFTQSFVIFYADVTDIRFQFQEEMGIPEGFPAKGQIVKVRGQDWKYEILEVDGQMFTTKLLLKGSLNASDIFPTFNLA